MNNNGIADSSTTTQFSNDGVLTDSPSRNSKKYTFDLYQTPRKQNCALYSPLQNELAINNQSNSTHNIYPINIERINNHQLLICNTEPTNKNGDFKKKSFQRKQGRHKATTIQNTSKNSLKTKKTEKKYAECFEKRLFGEQQITKSQEKSKWLQQQQQQKQQSFEKKCISPIKEEREEHNNYQAVNMHHNQFPFIISNDQQFQRSNLPLSQNFTDVNSAATHLQNQNSLFNSDFSNNTNKHQSITQQFKRKFRLTD